MLLKKANGSKRDRKSKLDQLVLVVGSALAISNTKKGRTPLFFQGGAHDTSYAKYMILSRLKENDQTSLSKTSPKKRTL